MGFTQPCFIRKNTPELKKKLEGFGYIMGESLNTNKSKGLICTKYRKVFNIICNADISKYDTDCGTNEELFLALAALRDDTDKNQYFICDKVSVTLGKTYDPDDYIYYQYDEFFDKQNWHKATVEEIIEHFKDKYG